MNEVSFPPLPSISRWGIALIAVMCIALAGCGAESKQAENPTQDVGEKLPPAQPEAEIAYINVHIPDSLPLNGLQVELGEVKTVGQAMSHLSELEVMMKDYPGMGRLLTSINGIRNDDNGARYWQYCLNGEIAGKGIDDTELENGDQIDWHFVSYNELPCKKIGE